jgi:hypothetical protein
MIWQITSGLSLLLITGFFLLCAYGAYKSEIKRGWFSVIGSVILVWAFVASILGAFCLTIFMFVYVVSGLFKTMIGG